MIGVAFGKGRDSAAVKVVPTRTLPARKPSYRVASVGR